MNFFSESIIIRQYYIYVQIGIVESELFGCKNQSQFELDWSKGMIDFSGTMFWISWNNTDVAQEH